jgi:hypothetical protein
MRDRRWPRRCAIFALVCSPALGACDAILGAGDRELNSTVVCTDDGCACAEGRGDCDKVPDNGCETELSSPKHCGACGRPCDNGVCTDGVCVCATGFADCDGDPTTSCDTSVADDASNCGACGRSCGDADCANSLCVPEPVTSTGPMYTFDLVGSTLYFATGPDMGMFRMEIGGAAPEAFGDPTVYVNLLKHHGDAVYWASEDAIFTTSTLTGETQQLAAMQIPGQRIAAGGGKVYWGNLDVMTDIASLHRTSITPGGMVEVVTALGDADYVADFAVTEDDVYWNDVAQMMRSPHDMLAPSLFKNVETPPTFMSPGIDGIVYTGSPGGTFLAPYGAGAVKQVADLEGYGVLTSDEQNVYFVTWTFGTDLFEFWRAPLSGDGAPVKLAEETFLLTSGPIHVDDKYLYWIGGGVDEIVRVPK